MEAWAGAATTGVVMAEGVVVVARVVGWEEAREEERKGVAMVGAAKDEVARVGAGRAVTRAVEKEAVAMVGAAMVGAVMVGA